MAVAESPAPDAGTERWSSALAELELLISAQEALVGAAERGERDDPVDVLAAANFAPPVGLPPLPAELAPELERLAARVERLGARLAAVIGRDRPSQVARRPRRTRATPTGTGFDAHA